MCLRTGPNPFIAQNPSKFHLLHRDSPTPNPSWFAAGAPRSASSAERGTKSFLIIHAYKIIYKCLERWWILTKSNAPPGWATHNVLTFLHWKGEILNKTQRFHHSPPHSFVSLIHPAALFLWRNDFPIIFLTSSFKGKMIFFFFSFKKSFFCE